MSYDFFNLFRDNVLNEGVYEDAKFFLFGVGFDSTETNLPGQRLGPRYIREALMHKDITYPPEMLNDLGDVLTIPGNVNRTLNNIIDAMREIEEHGLFSFPIMLGGEHTLTFAPAKYLKEKYKDLQLINLDAHYDFKSHYLDEKFNHSTVMRRIHELGINISMLGVRRWDEDEKEYSKNLISLNDLDPSIPTYLSIDLDYFDPAYAPGVGDKESGGYSFSDYLNLLSYIKEKRFNLVGMDVMELNPMIDREGITSVLAADIIIKFIEQFI